MQAVCEGLGVSERRARQVLGQHRSTQRHMVRPRADEEPLTAAIVELASRYGRYGYRRITALLRQAGWRVNAKRVERLWRQKGLKVPARQPKRGRLWPNDGSGVRLRPQHRNHVWTYDFMTERTHEGKAFRLLTVLDEFRRECLAIGVGRTLTSDDVLATLAELFVARGVPAHLRSDNGSELCAKVVREWLGRLGVWTLFIEPDSPWENGYNESFNGKLREPRYYPILLTLVSTGIRLGECLGLQMRDVDLEHGWLAVRRSLRKYQESSPKSGKGRTVYLPHATVELIRRWLDVIRTEAAVRGEAPHWLFPSQTGHCLDGCHVRDGFRRVLKAAGITRRIGLHDLRHTYASLAMQRGVDILLISRQMGHGSVAITDRVYGHLKPEATREVATAWEAILGRVRRNPRATPADIPA